MLYQIVSFFFYLFSQDWGGISAYPGMYLGGQGQRPCEEDRYLRNMNLRLCDRPNRREDSDVVRISARQPLHCNRTHKYSGLHSVCSCIVAPCCLVVFQPNYRQFCSDFYAFCCLSCCAAMFWFKCPIAVVVSVQPNHNPLFVMKGILALWSFQCKNIICF